MKKVTLYLESSIFGFYYDDKPFNQYKKESVRKLLEQIKEGLFEAITSPLTIKELSEAPSPYKEQLSELVEIHEEVIYYGDWRKGFYSMASRY